MKNLFVSYELAVIAKEKGFIEPCIKYYLVGSKTSIINGKDRYLEGYNYNSLKTRASMPIYQQLIDWLRENHKIHLQIVYESGNWCFIIYKLPSIKDLKFAESGKCEDGDLWKDSHLINTDWFHQENDSYYSALDAGLKEVLNNLP